MDQPTTTRQLRDAGLSGDEVARLMAGGVLTRIRRGGYVRAGERGTPDERHRELLATTLPLLHADSVLSHGSAAVLHGLPIWGPALSHVHVTRNRPNGQRHGSWVELHGSPLDPAEIVLAHGWPTTAVARTVVDVGRSLPLGQGVAVADRALANGVDPDDLEAAVRRARGWPGVRRARQAVAFADPRSESPGESVSRVQIQRYGLPAPRTQYEVRDRAGRLVGRTDFAWPELGTVGEFDGRVKYGRLLQPGDSVADVVYREKLREDQLRELGWQVVRWIWSELYEFGPVADRLRRAFVRSNSSRSLEQGL